MIIAALISWVNPDPRNPIVRFLWGVTEPLFRPFRRTRSAVADGRHRPLPALRARASSILLSEFRRSTRVRGGSDQEVSMRPRMTPLEIQKREFSRKWKGLDPLEVQHVPGRRRRGHGRPGPRERGPRRAHARASSRRTRSTASASGSSSRRCSRRSRPRKTSATRPTRRPSSSCARPRTPAERLTHNALQRAAEIEKAIHELKIQRTNFRLQLQKMIELFQQVLEFDREEDEKERPLSYLTRKARRKRRPGDGRARTVAVSPRTEDSRTEGRRFVAPRPRDRFRGSP